MSEASSCTHVGYADESHFNDGRFRSLCLVSMTQACVGSVTAAIAECLSNSNVNEIKWSGINSAKHRFAVQKIFDYVLNTAGMTETRIDVLVWDTEDDRHKIKGRDDMANLHRMYYHLLRVTLSKRWPDKAKWLLRPDEQTGLKWDEIQYFLDLASSDAEIKQDMFTAGNPEVIWRNLFNVVSFEAANSAKENIVQVADIFAGMAVFSRKNYDKYKTWNEANALQTSLFTVSEGESQKVSNAEKERFRALKYFDDECKKRRLGVSLKTYSGLKTINPNNPINFWWYEPQHEMDKAPVKEVWS